MNRWLQTRLYTCPKCGMSYVHDKGYRHALFECPKRDQSGKGRPATVFMINQGGFHGA